jgi:hypothetical protein
LGVLGEAPPEVGLIGAGEAGEEASALLGPASTASEVMAASASPAARRLGAG